MCRALEWCQVSCVPNPEMGLVCVMERALELTQATYTILQMAGLSPEMERREIMSLFWREYPLYDSSLLNEPGKSLLPGTLRTSEMSLSWAVELCSARVWWLHLLQGPFCS